MNARKLGPLVRLLVALAFLPLAHGQELGAEESLELRAGTRTLSLDPGSSWRQRTFTRLPELEASDDEDARRLARLARLLDGPALEGTRRLALHALHRSRPGAEAWFRIRVQEVDDVEDFLARRVAAMRTALADEGARERERNDVAGLGLRFARFDVPTRDGGTWPFEWFAWSSESTVLELVPLSFWEDVHALSRDARAVSVDLTLVAVPRYPDERAERQTQRHEWNVGLWLLGLAGFLLVIRWLFGRRSASGA